MQVERRIQQDFGRSRRWLMRGEDRTFWRSRTARAFAVMRVMLDFSLRGG